MDSLPIRVALLADHPEAVPILVKAFEEEWPGYYGPDGRGNAGRDLDACARREGIPVAFVAFQGEDLCGTMSLKAESITIRPNLAPWAAAGWVVPSQRRRGVGAALLRAVEERARTLGVPRLYCGTSAAGSLLERGGWRLLERVEYAGEDVGIYEKAL